METDINPFTADPKLLKQFVDYSTQIHGSGLEPALVELVNIRASQINGCANCLNMHTAAARKQGETEQRLHLVAAWREAPVFNDRERAALAWTEDLTKLSEKLPSDENLAALDAHFTKAEQLKLALMINVINGWNRLAVGFHRYEPSLGW